MNDVFDDILQNQDCQDDAKKKVLEILKNVTEGRNSDVFWFIRFFLP